MSKSLRVSFSHKFVDSVNLLEIGAGSFGRVAFEQNMEIF